MTILHMETELVRTVGRQLEQTSDQIQAEFEAILRLIKNIPWESPARDSYLEAVETLRKKMEETTQQGLILSRRVQIEVNEWEQTDAKFGEEGFRASQGVSSQPVVSNPVEGDKRPDNMRFLAELVMNGSDPIRSYQMGQNEYLMVIKGTSHDPNDSNNWGSAVTTGLGLSSDFQDQVRLALLSLPAGAVVHMAGYSQGGIVSQNLVWNKGVSDRVKIKSITTFGSPYSAPERNGTEYSRYAAEGDIVPYLEGRDAYTAILLTPFIGMKIAVAGGLIDQYPQTTIPADFSNGVFEPHHANSNSSYLEELTDLPFDISNWNGKPTVHDPGTPQSGAALLYKIVGSGTANTYKNATEKASRFFDNLF